MTKKELEKSTLDYINLKTETGLSISVDNGKKKSSSTQSLSSEKEKNCSVTN